MSDAPGYFFSGVPILTSFDASWMAKGFNSRVFSCTAELDLYSDMLRERFGGGERSRKFFKGDCEN